MRASPIRSLLAASAVLTSAAPSVVARSHAMSASASSGEDLVGHAFNWSILVLMAAPYAIAGAVAGWIFYRSRRGSGRVLLILERGLRLRCPCCGGSALYTGWFAMSRRCTVCGFRYEREQGYFVGAIYVNYALTVGVAAGAVVALDWTIGLTLAEQLALGITLAVLVPLAFFRHSRSLWLSLNYLLTSTDEPEDDEEVEVAPSSTRYVSAAGRRDGARTRPRVG
jgi:uncharacterized protein (DUF983 family)